MSTLLLQNAALGHVRRVDLTLPPGRYVVLSSEREPLGDLVDLVAGRRTPSSGQALLDGVAPSKSAAARKLVAAVHAEENLPPARTVAESVGHALRARAESAPSATRLLEMSGLSHLAEHAPVQLGPREARSISLALALQHSTAQLFVLYEPLTTLLASTFVLEALEAHTARGAIVLSATSSSADANLLGGAWLSLELGRLTATAGATPRLGVGPWQQLLVETPDARLLAQAIHESALGLTTEQTSATRLNVTGVALDETVRELIRIARESGIDLTRIEPALPPVEALMAARAGFARGAYEASLTAAKEPLRPPVPPYGGGSV